MKQDLIDLIPIKARIELRTLGYYDYYPKGSKQFLVQDKPIWISPPRDIHDLAPHPFLFYSSGQTPQDYAFEMILPKEWYTIDLALLPHVLGRLLHKRTVRVCYAPSRLPCYTPQHMHLLSAFGIPIWIEKGSYMDSEDQHRLKQARVCTVEHRLLGGPWIVKELLVYGITHLCLDTDQIKLARVRVLQALSQMRTLETLEVWGMGRLVPLELAQVARITSLRHLKLTGECCMSATQGNHAPGLLDPFDVFQAALDMFQRLELETFGFEYRNRWIEGLHAFGALSGAMDGVETFVVQGCGFRGEDEVTRALDALARVMSARRVVLLGSRSHDDGFDDETWTRIRRSTRLEVAYDRV